MELYESIKERLSNYSSDKLRFYWNQYCDAKGIDEKIYTLPEMGRALQSDGYSMADVISMTKRGTGRYNDMYYQISYGGESINSSSFACDLINFQELAEYLTADVIRVSKEKNVAIKA